MAIWLKDERKKLTPSLEEIDVAKYIADCPRGDFSRVLETDRRMGVFFHLSPMRESLLNWYPFAADATLLEIGGGMGALTSLLCSRCARIISLEPDAFRASAILRRCSQWDNLTVINANEYAGEENFDYIVLVDPISLDMGYLAQMRKLLKTNGRLLLATENLFGLRYWCGKRSKKTGLPFDSFDEKGVGFSKAQISLNLNMAGFEGQKWYYPMTDHWYAQDIFSENCLPETYSSARLRPYIEPDHTLVMNEQRLYKDIIQNRVFEFFSNAYLVEARCNAMDRPCGVDYAAVTTYRTAEKRFATLVLDNDTVRKVPLHPDGKQGVSSLIKNHLALAERGIHVLPLTRDGDCVVMPRMRYETLIDHWQRTLQNGSFDFDAFSAMFDKFHEIIIRSSEADPPGSHGWDPVLGPVLKTGFLELVPANCFYDKEKNELIFFDQEFIKPHCPLKIILTRVVLSINYSTLSMDKTTAAFLDNLKSRFRLDECWDLLVDEERRFLDSVFNYKCINPIFSRRAVDEKQIKDNLRKLLRTRGSTQILDEVPRHLINEGVRQVAIYGYGVRGSRLHSLLTSYGIDVLFAVDIRGRGAAPGASINIHSSLEEAPHTGNIDMIIISPRDGADKVAESLRQKATFPVMTVADIYGAIDDKNMNPGI